MCGIERAKDEEREAIVKLLVALAHSDHELDGLTAEEAVLHAADLISKRLASDRGSHG